MTDRKQALTNLLEKVEVGNAPKYTPDYEFALFPIKGMWSAYQAMDAYDGSLDAAKALHEAVLPVGFWGLIDTDGRCDVYDLQGGPGHSAPIGSGVANCPARAWLIAILKALIAQED